MKPSEACCFNLYILITNSHVSVTIIINAITDVVFCQQSLQAKLSFSSKDIVALSCSWCKDAYHNKESCFNLQRIGEECSLGMTVYTQYRNSIILRSLFYHFVTNSNKFYRVTVKHYSAAVVDREAAEKRQFQIIAKKITEKKKCVKKERKGFKERTKNVCDKADTYG